MRGGGGLPSIGFVSTYPPTLCGLATFTAALRQAIADGRGSEEGLGVVRLVESSRADAKPEVVYEHRNADRPSLRRAIETLSWFDGVIIQHEFGIFGGPDGEEVLDFLSDLDVPASVTLHTVLSRPSPSQRSILEGIVTLAERTVVMSGAARDRLVDGYDVDAAAVRVIPHGAAAKLGGPSLANGARPVAITWGLMGPGKGLELAIEAFAGLKDVHPVPRYVILGETHPRVKTSQGDSYLHGLVTRAGDLGLGGVVEFDTRYLDVDALALAVRRADVVVLPYTSTEQVTSGVLVEAVAAGKPVIATAFPHAIELLASGAGIIVPHDDPAALTAALRRVLTDPATATGMAKEARRIATALYWPAIAHQYEQTALEMVAKHRLTRAVNRAHHPRKGSVHFLSGEGVVARPRRSDNVTEQISSAWRHGAVPRPRPRFSHLRRLTDDQGIWEHARYTSPRTEHGYCTDDNARALIVICRNRQPTPDLIELARIYLTFLQQAQLAEGGFHNRRDADGSWLDEVGSDDSQGRALWALGTVASRGPAPWMRVIGLEMFGEVGSFDSVFPRSNAFAVLGAAEVLRMSPGHTQAWDILDRCIRRITPARDDERWPWPESRLAYDNARIPQAFMIAGTHLGDGKLVDSGLRLLQWLAVMETRDGHFSFTPVGGWAQGEERPGFDQQPIEGAAMAEACSLAWSLTGDDWWKERVQSAAHWFVGDNDLGAVLYDAKTGGCRDGLTRTGPNENQGAESTLAALAALQQLEFVG
ncbi:MAG: glycosyltransferase [Actinobacteria bacterium]|nr:glycosyltransferase [Actinomycetota bacterium]